MSLFDIKALFHSKSRLRHISEELETAQGQQQHSLADLNARQSLIEFEEICWQAHKCFYRIKASGALPGTKKMVQNMVRSILMEYYGPAASQLQLLLR